MVSRTLIGELANEIHGLVHWSTKPNREERLRGKKSKSTCASSVPAAVCFRRLLRHPDPLARFITSTGRRAGERESEQISAAMSAMGNSIYRIINLPIICCSPPPLPPSVHPSAPPPSVRPDAQSSRKFDSVGRRGGIERWREKSRSSMHLQYQPLRKGGSRHREEMLHSISFGEGTDMVLRPRWDVCDTTAQGQYVE